MLRRIAVGSARPGCATIGAHDRESRRIAVADRADDELFIGAEGAGAETDVDQAQSWFASPAWQQRYLCGATGKFLSRLGGTYYRVAPSRAVSSGRSKII